METLVEEISHGSLGAVNGQGDGRNALLVEVTELNHPT